MTRLFKSWNFHAGRVAHAGARLPVSERARASKFKELPQYTRASMPRIRTATRSAIGTAHEMAQSLRRLAGDPAQALASLSSATDVDWTLPRNKDFFVKWTLAIADQLEQLRASNKTPD